ncbi:hypothetical protein D9615_001128 [Tricholomella constricta]|uniref:Lysophospholipase NTE1 n=1 Tax=Tricholomella constricta TaxID=117010 RepID=A0A8H5HKA6_9AGAR|nr:hypothetical protein D9615_001128 [Tricholomella constricta]
MTCSLNPARRTAPLSSTSAATFLYTNVYAEEPPWTQRCWNLAIDTPLWVWYLPLFGSYLNFWNFAVLFVLSAIALNYWIRFRYLNDYTQLKEPPLVKPDVNELHPDVNTDPPPTFHNYLDDFLQAVRVFGFVFHELARHLQTRRLIAGDSMSLDQDKSFYCVVDGMVQVFAQTGQNAEQQRLWDHEDMNGYQLLNEVGSGGTLSSLFTILSLFTEDVKMSWQDDHPDIADFTENDTDAPGPLRHRANSDVSQFDLEHRRRSHARKSSVSSTASTVHASGMLSPTRVGSLSPTSHDGSHTSHATSRMPSFSSHHNVRPSTVHRGGVVARATEDSTLAVIPAEAFRRLTKNFPKATGHIVQVILTRFSRVTFNAAHKYLGLTSEVLRTEKAINDIACHPLPASFYESGGVQYLRQRFDGRSSDTENDYFSFTNSSVPTSPKLKSQDFSDAVSKASGASSKTELPNVSLPPLKRNQSSPFTRGSRDTVQAGDLLIPSTLASDSYRPSTRSYSILNTPRVTRNFQEHEAGRPLSSSLEDFDLREAVMSCIAKSIGLLQPPLSGSDSVEASPAIPPTDPPRFSSPDAFTSSPFGSLSLLDLNDDGSSLTASSVTSSGDYMSGLDNEVEILFFAAGSTLAKAGELNAGFLDILLPSEAPYARNLGNTKSGQADPPTKGDKLQQKLLFTVKPGGIAGYLYITAKTDTYVGFLSSPALERLLEKRPIVLLTLAKRLISMLSPLVLHIDASLDWMQVNAGQVLWRPEDVSDSFYIVINGRLRAITESESGAVTIVGEYGQGDTVGELDVITSSPRRNTVHAIRDTELIRMPQTLFNAISARLLRMIASRVRDEVDSSTTAQARNSGPDLGRNNTNLKTVAILPVTRNVPIDAFARKLQAALEGIGASTSFLNQASISSHLGRHAFTRMGKLKSAGWLADQEQKYRTVLYVADSPVNSSWTQTCIRQADCVMIVGMGDDPSLGEYERLLLSMKTTARKELILLHPDRSVAPGSTREWLKGLVLPIPKSAALPKDPDAVTALKNLKDKVQSGIQKYRGTTADLRPQRSPHVNDFARLARRICGKSIGLVLGGGGARGIAHLGLIRALEEYDIPIDHIAGTSIGALIGGLYAREGDLISSAGRAKQFSGRMGNIWRILSDVTYPIVAYTTGHEFNRAIFKAFYDLHIEDMWLPYFCNTTNIITSRMEIHETGYAWRFILDNLPVSAMFSMGASEVFACDVGSLDDNSPRNFGDSVSGWWLLLNRWNPFSNARHVPAITEIQSRLAYVSSVKTLEDAKVANGCFYIQMPVHEYGTLQFGKFEEIHRKGYLAAMEILKKLDEEDGKEAADRGRKKGRRQWGSWTGGRHSILIHEQTSILFDNSRAGDTVCSNLAHAFWMTTSMSSETDDHATIQPAESLIDVNLLKEIAKKALVDALNSVNGAKTLVLDASLAGPLGLVTEVSLLKVSQYHHGVDKMFWLEPGSLSSTTANIVYLCRPMIKYVKIIADHIKRHAKESRKHTYTLLLVPRISTLVTRILEEEGVLGDITISSYNLQFIPLADDVVSLENDSAFKDLWVDGDETVIYDSAQALTTFQKLYGLFPRIVGKGDGAARLATLLTRETPTSSNSSSPDTLLTPSEKTDSLIVLDRRVDMITPLLTQLTYEGLIDELMGIKNSPTAASAAGPSTTAPTANPPVPSLKKDAKKKHHLTTTTDPLFEELRDVNFSAVGRKLNRVARQLDEDYKTNLQSKTVAQLRDFVGKLGGLQTEHQSLRLRGSLEMLLFKPDTGLSELLVPLTRTEEFNKSLEIQQNLLASYEVTAQVTAIEEMIAQGSEMQVVLRLLCLASITSGGIKAKPLDNIKREILQSYGYNYLPLLLSLASPPLGILLPHPLPATAPPSLAASKYPFTTLRKSLRLLIDDTPEGMEEVENDISFTYSGYAPISVRLVQCIAQKGGVISNPAEKAASDADGKRSGPQGKVQAHPIVGWKGFEDVVAAIPGETVDIVQKGTAGRAPPMASLLQPREKGTITVVFFLGGCTYTEIAALRWVGRQNRGRKFLIATTGIISGASIVDGIAGVAKAVGGAKAAVI